MRIYRLPALALLLAFSISLASSQATPQKQTSSDAQITSWKQIPIPALRPFHPQEPKRVELRNWLVLFVQEDHELPLIDGTIRIRGGSREEPADKTGFIEIYSEVWRTGGTKSKTGDQLDDALEMKAARVETIGGSDSTY